LICANRQIARQANRRKAERKIVSDPTATGVSAKMSRTLQGLAIDVAMHRSARIDKAGDVADPRLQRET